MGLQAALQPLRMMVLLAAALGFLLAAMGRAGMPQGGAAAHFTAWAGPVLRRVRPGGIGYGLALGLLPCGLVYLALGGACASGGPVTGALYMAAFGAGTVPVLAAVGAGSHVVGRRLTRLAPLVLAANAAVLLVAALAGMLV
jgi:sulfite exporter TauE/SafE